ncbi:MAG TPA: protein tyrosine phosphatase [Jatrophihabitantaceae bacterium]|jgi:protein-tyrosine phosphatase
MSEWAADAPGVLQLPSGRRVRGRGLRRGDPDGAPEFGLYLLSRDPGPMGWPTRWVKWPDFWLPSDRAAFREALDVAWQRAATERVEFACNGGHGRTGTALACLAVLDGLPAGDAVAFVRANYHPKAVETPWQRRFVRRFVA